MARQRARPLWVLLALAVAIAMLNLAAALVYTIPESVRERGIRAWIKAERERLAATELRVDSLRSRAAVLEENSRNVQELYRRVTGARQTAIVNAQNRLWRMAEEVGLEPKTLSSEQAAVEGVRLTRLRVTMPLSGSYDQLLSFLERVEKEEQFVVVDQINLRTSVARIRALDVVLSVYFHEDAPAERAVVAPSDRMKRKPRP